MPTPADVDDFVCAAAIPEAAQMRPILDRNAAAGLPAIDVSPAQGKFLAVLARSIGARRVLEVGTLGGYSTIWLARAVGESGEVVTLEYDPLHAATARANVDAAGVGARVDIRVGAALDSLPGLTGPFDLVFIDADKENNANYVRAALGLARPGALIIVDNVVREGAVADAASTDPRILASREVIELLGTEPRLEATVLQTTGAKGWDGFAIAVVTGA